MNTVLDGGSVRIRAKARAIAAASLAALAIAPLTACKSADSSAGAASAPSASVGATATTTTAAGGIGKEDLGNATLSVPAWPKGFADSCPTGSVKLDAGKHGILQLQGEPAYADVDHDGTAETVVLLSCSPQGQDYKVLALRRDAQGKIVTLGQVVGSAGNTGKQGADIETIWAIQAGENGQVRVDVGEYRPCCDAAQASQHQWRTYGWNGSAFTQTGGPTSFAANPNVTDLSISAERLTMTATGSGSWEGTVKVTVKNNGQFATPGKLRLSFGLPSGLTAQSTPDCTIQPGVEPVPCLADSVPAGGTRVVTLKISATTQPPASQFDVWAAAADDQGRTYPDRKESVTTKVQLARA
ncbi:hypothetical protein [Dactylosporangium salmoneum]|uniref:DUF11 domain-containing protein n=1 Tax=Dactylosporangium salmoneum TaxID=53361 RepID=A0ABP5UAL5_9ACTN